MRTRTSRLHRLVLLAEAEERQLGALMRLSLTRVAVERDRQGELTAYRQSIDERTRLSRNLPASHWKDCQTFVARLDQAVRAQQGIAGDCERSAEIHRRQWQEKRRRVESLTRVTSRFQQEERLRAERLEQRALDDRHVTAGVYEDTD